MVSIGGWCQLIFYPLVDSHRDGRNVLLLFTRRFIYLQWSPQVGKIVMGRQTGWAPCTVFYFNLEIEARGFTIIPIKSSPEEISYYITNL